MDSPREPDYISIYQLFITAGYKAAGITFEDVVRNGGIEKTRTRLHYLAAEGLMKKDETIIDVEVARSLVTSQVESVSKRKMEGGM